MSLPHALLIAFVGWLTQSNILGGNASSQIFNKPIMAAFFCGLLMGDMKSAMIVGSVLQAMYIGSIAVGGVNSMPNIQILQWFVIPVAIMQGGSAEVAVAIALPLGVVNETITQIQRNIFKVAFVHAQDKAITDGKLKVAKWMPFISQSVDFLTYIILIPALLMVGSEAVLTAVGYFPQAVTSILKVFNGMLPLLGFGMLLLSLVKSKVQFVYFVFGFVLFKVVGVSLIGTVAFGAVIALILFQCGSFDNKEAV